MKSCAITDHRPSRFKFGYRDNTTGCKQPRRRLHDWIMPPLPSHNSKWEHGNRARRAFLISPDTAHITTKNQRFLFVLRRSKRGRFGMASSEGKFYTCFDYREIEKTILEEFEKKKSQWTAEQILAEKECAKQKFQKFQAFIKDYNLSYHRVLNVKRRQTFIAAARRLKAFAQLHEALMEVEIANNVGRISLTTAYILHTTDTIDETRFLMAWLFLHFESIDIEPVENGIKLIIIEDFCDKIKNS